MKWSQCQGGGANDRRWHQCTILAVLIFFRNLPTYVLCVVFQVECSIFFLKWMIMKYNRRIKFYIILKKHDFVVKRLCWFRPLSMQLNWNFSIITKLTIKIRSSFPLRWIKHLDKGTNLIDSSNSNMFWLFLELSFCINTFVVGELFWECW